MLNELSDELAAHKIEVVGVNFDDDPRTRTLEVAETLGIRFPTLTRAEVARLRVRSPSVMPTTYIMAPGNKIAGSLIGLQTRESILARLTQLGALQAP